MEKLINRSKLERSLELSIQSWGRDCNSNAPVIVRTYEDVLQRIKNAPVTEIMHCKDCVYYGQVDAHGGRDGDGWGYCRVLRTAASIYPGDFCSRAKGRASDAD